MERLLYRLAFGCAVAGLGILLVVMVSGKAWPDPIYAIGAPLGMGFIALCLVFLAARWAVRARQLWQIAALVLAAVVCLAGFFLRR